MSSIMNSVNEFRKHFGVDYPRCREDLQSFIWYSSRDFEDPALGYPTEVMCQSSIFASRLVQMLKPHWNYPNKVNVVRTDGVPSETYAFLDGELHVAVGHAFLEMGTKVTKAIGLQVDNDNCLVSGYVFDDVLYAVWILTGKVPTSLDYMKLLKDGDFLRAFWGYSYHSETSDTSKVADSFVRPYANCFISAEALRNQSLVMPPLDEGQYHRMVDALMSRKNILLKGKKGTGKGVLCNALALEVADHFKDRETLVYRYSVNAYSNCIDVSYGEKFTGEFKVGVLGEALLQAMEHPNVNYVLILDEFLSCNDRECLSPFMELLSRRGNTHHTGTPSGVLAFTFVDNLYILANGNSGSATNTKSILDDAVADRFKIFTVRACFEDAKLFDAFVRNLRLPDDEFTLIRVNVLRRMRSNLQSYLKTKNTGTLSGISMRWLTDLLRISEAPKVDDYEKWYINYLINDEGVVQSLRNDTHCGTISAEVLFS